MYFIKFSESSILDRLPKASSIFSLHSFLKAFETGQEEFSPVLFVPSQQEYGSAAAT